MEFSVAGGHQVLVSRHQFGVVTWFVLFGLKRCRDPILRSRLGLALRVSRHGLACSRSRPGFSVATWPGLGLGQLGGDLVLMS